MKRAFQWIQALVTCLAATAAAAEDGAVFEGNWEVEWTGIEEPDAPKQMRISLFRERGHGCKDKEMSGCEFRSVLRNAEGWSLSYLENIRYVQGITLDDGRMLVDHAHGIFGHWGGQEKLVAADVDSLRGAWSYGDQAGQGIWRRAQPEITSVTVLNLPGRGELVSARQIGPRHVALEMDATTSAWDENLNFPHLRPKLLFRLKGRALWGRHSAAFPGSIGLDPSAVAVPRGPDQAHYLEFEVTFWPGFEAGRHRLRVTGQEVTVDIALSKGAPECDWRKYFQTVRDEGTALIDAFEADTLRLAEQDHDRVIDEKLFPYGPNVRASFVSYDENAALMHWEALAGEMIANQGGDNALRDARRKVINGLREANRVFWQSAFEGKACPGFHDPEGQRALRAPGGSALRAATRSKYDLAAQRAMALRMEEAYMRIFFRKLANTGSFDSKLRDSLWGGFNRTLGRAKLPPEQTTALREELRKLGPSLRARRDKGEKLTPEQVREAVSEAFRRAGVEYVPVESHMKSGPKFVGELSKWALAAMTSYVLTPDLPAKFAAELTGGGYVLTAKDHIEIMKAVFDIGTMTGLEEQGLPTLNAVREDGAHLEVLIRRYELFGARYERFLEDYRGMLGKARRAAQGG